MPHYIPFLVLIIISVLIFVFVLWNTRDKKLIILLFFMIGLAYVLEYFILVLFKSYQYNPNFVHETDLDNILGSLVSQAFAFPVIAVLIGAYQLKFRYIVLISFIFMGIEELFISLGVYTQYWWKTIYTGIFMTIGFVIAKTWHAWLSDRFERWIHVLNLFFSLLAINTTIMLFLLAMFKPHSIHVGWFQSETRDVLSFNTLYVWLLTALYSWGILKRSLTMLGCFFLGFRIADFVLLSTDILVLPKWNSLGFFALLDAVVILFTAKYNQFIVNACYGTDSKKFIAFMRNKH
ncbi:hypothetical protein P5663_17050 [Priestia flexa]|uniref:hypothetical protein n=1 Tax=Priestia flexa TaxID=86664 RepID=UPI00240E7569|nr:hypothetical protein [Priestia flexa]WEZ07725.1 hypothetical protein P5663_17050 [Priestia flexa]